MPLIRELTSSPATSAKVSSSPPNSTQPPPTFRQFVHFLLATPTHDYDPHWLPIHAHCAPCRVHYHAVVKVETMAEDFQHLKREVPAFREVGLGHLQEGLEVPRENEERIVKAHMLQLTKRERRELFERYKFDFLFFDYHPNKY